MSFEMVDFRKDVIEACRQVPVVIDFWAEWCGPCKVLGPVIEKLAVEARGRWKLVKINTDLHPQVAAQFGVQGIPSVKMVFQGQLIGEFTGALPEHKIREWLNRYLPPSEEEVEEDRGLDELLASGDRRAVKRFLENLAGSDPENKDHRAKLAMACLPGHPADAEKLLTDLSDSKYEIEREALASVKSLAGRLQQGFPDAANPQVSALYRQAAQALFQEQFEAALDGFIQVMMRDRAYDDDGARKACVAIFALLSELHPLTKAWRRRFSMALY